MIPSCSLIVLIIESISITKNYPIVKHLTWFTLLYNFPTGIFHTYQEKDKLKQTILAYFNLYLENNLKVFPIGLEKYSRKNLTKKLVELITDN